MNDAVVASVNRQKVTSVPPIQEQSVIGDGLPRKISERLTMHARSRDVPGTTHNRRILGVPCGHHKSLRKLRQTPVFVTQSRTRQSITCCSLTQHYCAETNQGAGTFHARIAEIQTTPASEKLLGRTDLGRRTGNAEAPPERRHIENRYRANERGARQNHQRPSDLSHSASATAGHSPTPIRSDC
jgi:hypothetical protein